MLHTARCEFPGFFPIEELGKERKKREEKIRGKEKRGKICKTKNIGFAKNNFKSFILI